MGSSIQRPGKSAAPGRARQIGHRQHQEKKQRIQGHEAITREQVRIDGADDRDAEKERKLLAELLTRIVAQQNITPAVHPGYRQLGEASRS